MILETKLNLPQPKPGTLLRTGLIELIKNNLDKKLILITADAGYGKTTLLGQLVKAARLPAVFYDLDTFDSDVLVFYSYLVEGIMQIDPALVKYSKELSKQGGETGKNLELLFGTLINELHNNRKEELFIILDNYHNIAEDSTVHRALDFFIDRLPERIHVIVASRSVPSLPSLARWRAKQNMCDLSRDDLVFGSEEIATLLKIIHKTVFSEEDVRQVAAHTEGWITGICLILQSVVKNEISICESLQNQAEANQPLFEYFANEILALESPQMQTFLTKCSILPTMTPEACDAILNANDSEQVLQSLEKRHLLVSKYSRDEYKYHHLFRDFLKKRLQGEKTALNLKAAQYYRLKGNIEHAIEHYLEAFNYGKAVGLICQITDDMIVNSKIKTLADWIGRIPESDILKRPDLLLTISELNLALGRVDEAETRCNQAIPLLIQRGDNGSLAVALLERANLFWMKKNCVQTLKAVRRTLAFVKHGRFAKCFRVQIEGKALNLSALAWTKLGAYSKAKACLLRARRMREFVGNPYDYYAVESNLALLYASRGEDWLAAEAFHTLMLNIGSNYYCDAGVNYVNAELAAINTGDIERAEQALDKGWELCRPYDDPRTKAHFELGNGILCLQKAQWEPALRYLKEAASLFSKLGLASMHCFALRDICRIHRYRCDYAKAREYLNQALAAASGRTDQLLASLQLERSLLLSCQGDFAKAGNIARSLIARSRKLGWGRIVFMSHLAAAVIYCDQGKQQQAVLQLRQAVRLSKLKGYKGLLVRELRASSKLTGLAANQKWEPEYLGQILFECQKYRLATCEPSIAVRLLGKFELSAGGAGRKIILKRKTTKAILAFFLLHQQERFSWEEIAAWVWPESPAPAAHQMFKRAVWQIHSCSPVLKAALRYNEQLYYLALESTFSIDVLEFQSLLNKAAAATDAAGRIGFLEQAAGLYRGPLLANMYYDWIDALRNSLDAKYTAALGALAHWYFEKQEHAQSALSCQKYLDAEELEESIHRLLIANYIRLGQKSRAVNQYNKLAKILKDNFGSKPSPETFSLIKSLG